MNKRTLRGAVGFLTICSSAFLFQNCGEGFVAVQNDGKLQIQADHSPHIMSNSTLFEPNKDVEFDVHSDVPLTTASYKWTHKLGNISGGCTVKNNDSSTNYILNCPNSGGLSVGLTLTMGTEVKVLNVYSVAVSDPVPPPAGMTVEFNIKAGTGSSPYNTMQTFLETYIDQTLKVNNQDTITHQIHTGGAPFPHGAAITAGSSASYKITAAYDFTAASTVYDHLVGTTAAFYIKAYDPKVLYANNCANCHNALATSEKFNKTAAQIKSAILNDNSMKTKTYLINLTPTQIEAIAYALKK